MVCVLAGCALNPQQKDAVGGFGKAASILGDVTSAELSAMRADTVRMNTERLLLSGKSKDPRLGDQRSLDRGFELSRVETVSGATRALAAYGKLLAALASDTQSATIASASHDFSANLGLVPGASERLGEGQRKAIGNAVAGIGSGVAEWKRKQAVIAIVNHAENAVDALCDLLIRDFAPADGWVSLQLQVVEAPLMVEATNALYDGANYTERKVALDGFRLAHESRLRRTEVLERVTKAAQAMKRANKALIQAVNNTDTSFAEIQDFVQRSRSLRAAVNAATSNPEGAQHG